MLEGKKLILATKPFATERRAESWRHTLLTISALILSYTATFGFDHLLVKVLFAILTSLLSLRMFIIYHDYLHKTILQKSMIANAIFTFWGLYILAPKSIWKRSHDYHHKHNSKLYTASIGSIPIITKQKFLNLKKKDRIAYLFMRHPATIALGHVFAFTYGMCIQPLLRSPMRHLDSALALVLHYGIAVIIYFVFGLTDLLIGYVLPCFISGAIGSYLFYAQHNFPGTFFRDKDGWTYIDAALLSSSYMKMGKVMNWFTGNIGYHHIHHLNARIPFYRLEEAFNKIQELRQTKSTSLYPKDIMQCLKLKVWDPEENRMIGLKELEAEDRN